MSAIGQPRIPPSDWKFLLDLWDQLAYWASSLIFVLAALLVPRAARRTSAGTIAGRLGVMIAAALAARAAGAVRVLPLLTRLGLGQRVERQVQRGDSLGRAARRGHARAGAGRHRKREDRADAVQRFVAVHATGFVLFTLLVQGLTLRPLITWLGLDRLSPFDQALRRQVLALSRPRRRGARPPNRRSSTNSATSSSLASRTRTGRSDSCRQQVADQRPGRRDRRASSCGWASWRSRSANASSSWSTSTRGPSPAAPWNCCSDDVGQLLDRTRTHGRPRISASGRAG